MIRRPLLIVAVLVLIIGIAVNGGWFYARWLAGHAADDWAAAQRADGIDISWEARDFFGWPHRLHALFRSPRATITAPNRQISWNGADSAVRFYLLDPDTIDFGAPGRHDVIVTQGGQTAAFALDAATLDARAETGPGGVFRNLVAGATEATLKDSDDKELAAVDAVQILWEQPPDILNDPAPVTLRLALRADQLTLAPELLPETPSPVLGNEISVVRANFDLNGAIQTNEPVPLALADWRDQGGTVDVERLEIAWGPMRLVGDGTLALDAALQPEGAFSARISGLADVLTAMERASMIDARTAAIARITLAVLTRRSEDGGAPEARVPLTIQNRQLSIGPVALFKLPAITWR